jgi:hypothetical protein
MDDRDKYILELEEKVQALEIKNTRLEVERMQRNTRGAGAKNLPDKIVNEIFERYSKGERVESLAIEYDLSTNTVYQKIRNLKEIKKKKSYSEKEVTEAISNLIYVVDVISEATYECDDSIVPKTYEELIAHYDKNVCGIDLKRLVKRVSQKYDTLDKFLREEGITFRESLQKLFNCN